MSQGFTRGVPIDTDPNLALDSDLVVPSQKAVKDYVDTGLNTKQDTLTLTTAGTSGAATLIGATLNIPQYSGGGSSPLTTKGDLYTFSTVDARLGIGANATMLMADSAATTGNKWVALSGDATIAGTGAITLSSNLKTGSFGVTVDGVTAIVQAGQIGYVVMPYDGTITRWTITSNVSGSISFDIWKDTLIDTIPTIGDSIVGGVYPSITGTNFGTSTSLGSWTSTTFLAGHIFGFYVNSASTIKNATLTIRTTRS
jgi:hypothetical protein